MELMKHIIAQSSQESLAPVEAESNQAQPVVTKGSEQREVLVSALVRSTRAQEKREQSRVQEDELASAQSECRPAELSDVVDFQNLILKMNPLLPQLQSCAPGRR